MDATEGISSVEGVACPPPGDLPNPGIEPTFLMSPAFTGGFFTTSTTWEALYWLHMEFIPSQSSCASCVTRWMSPDGALGHTCVHLE